MFVQTVIIACPEVAGTCSNPYQYLLGLSFLRLFPRQLLHARAVCIQLSK